MGGRAAAGCGLPRPSQKKKHVKKFVRHVKLGPHAAADHRPTLKLGWAAAGRGKLQPHQIVIVELKGYIFGLVRFGWFIQPQGIALPEPRKVVLEEATTCGANSMQLRTRSHTTRDC